ncbi:MAG: hypothetical protein JWM12_4101, partial [Ilumatobacteraceae bacterium]|nr:hypothetical protein [Ilumatobacteraceae bacterium]
MTQPAHDLPTDFDVALADACAGGSAGLTFLFRRYHPRVLRYLRTRVPRLADDISG